MSLVRPGAAPEVVAILIADTAGAPMRRLARVHAGEAGLDGDRYAVGRGHWSYHPPFVEPVTFVEAEAAERVARELGIALDPSALRRNVVTRGVRLAALIGRRFAIGDAVFTGIRPCDPCGYLDGLLAAPVRAALGADGGLRATVAQPGTFATGDALQLL